MRINFSQAGHSVGGQFYPPWRIIWPQQGLTLTAMTMLFAKGPFPIDQPNHVAYL